MTGARENIADIVCIGQQRAMTSWLHHVLAAHPRTWVFPNFDPVTSTSKEAHYWDWNHHRGERWYRVLMRPEQDTQRALDFTPDYAALPPAQIADCRRLNPGAKVVMIVRDPLARALSALRMHTLWANVPADAPPLALDQALLGRLAHAHARALALSDAAPQIARWRRAYPDLIVQSYETLRADPVAAAWALIGQLNLATDSLTDATRTEIETRAAKRIWATPAYQFSPDVLYFLDGATRAARARLADLGLLFTEGDELLKAVS